MSVARVTMADVARRANVSVATVSRVLSGGATTTQHTRATVLAAVRSVGYTSPHARRQAAAPPSRCIGVLVPAVGGAYVEDFLAGVHLSAAQRGFQPLIVSGHGHAPQEVRAIQSLRGHAVGALIVQDGALSDVTLRQQANRVPLVTVGRWASGTGLVELHIDQEAAAHAAVRYLLDLGHRDIAHLAGPRHHPHAARRLAGYRRALSEAGLAVSAPLVVRGDFLRAGGQRGMDTLLARAAPFTAVFAANDEMALGAMRALRRHGRCVPRDVSIVGFDDLRGLSTEGLGPSLTTVHQPIFEMGVTAGAAAVALACDEPPPTRTFEAPVVPRATCARRADPSGAPRGSTGAGRHAPRP